jgi:hypothetical protein
MVTTGKLPLLRTSSAQKMYTLMEQQYSTTPTSSPRTSQIQQQTKSPGSSPRGTGNSTTTTTQNNPCGPLSPIASPRILSRQSSFTSMLNTSPRQPSSANDNESASPVVANREMQRKMSIVRDLQSALSMTPSTPVSPSDDSDTDSDSEEEVTPFGDD